MQIDCCTIDIVVPFAGDHIRIKRPLYYHHMIVAAVHNDREITVIHFSGGREDTNATSEFRAEMVASSFSSKGRGAEVREDRITYSEEDISNLEVLTYPEGVKLFKPEEAIRRARSRLGEGGYNVFFNNCESFVNWVLTNRRSSEQGDTALVHVTRAGSRIAAGAMVGGTVGSLGGPVGVVVGGATGAIIGAFSTIPQLVKLL